MEAADHGKPIKSTTAIIHVFLSGTPTGTIQKPLVHTSHIKAGHQNAKLIVGTTSSTKSNKLNSTEASLINSSSLEWGITLPTTAKDEFYNLAPDSEPSLDLPRSIPDQKRNTVLIMDKTRNKQDSKLTTGKAKYGGVFKKKMYAVEIFENNEAQLNIISLQKELKETWPISLAVNKIEF